MTFLKIPPRAQQCVTLYSVGKGDIISSAFYCCYWNTFCWNLPFFLTMNICLSMCAWYFPQICPERDILLSRDNSFIWDNPPPPAKEKQTILPILEFFNIWSKVSGIKSGKTTKAEANSFLGFPLFVVGVTTFCNLGDIIINTAVSTVLMFNELLQEII